MTSAFESAINELMANIEQRQSELAHLHRGVSEMTGTAQSKRRQVSAVVDARGDLVELKFHGQTYRKLAPTELATIIVETVRQARQTAQTQVWESMGDAIPKGASVAELVDGSYDWGQAFAETLALPKPLMDFLENPPTNGLDGGILGMSARAERDAPPKGGRQVETDGDSPAKSSESHHR